jgi:molybdopterin-guanine dinucleotide biosynthesis protein A
VIHWLILTGGASSRLGTDKATADFDGRPLVDRALEAVSDLSVSGTASVVGAEFSGGPAAAVVAQLANIRDDFVGVLAVDMPLISSALATVVESVRLASHEDLVEAWVPVDSDGRAQWLCGVYRRLALIRASESQSMWRDAPFHRLVAGLDVAMVPIPSSVSLLDIDTPEDFQRALEAARDLGT